MVINRADVGVEQRLLPAFARRQDFKLAVFGVGVAHGKGGLQAFPHGEAGGQEQETAGKARVGGVGVPVGGLPDDEHRHNQRLARAGSHLVADAGDAVVAPGIQPFQFLDYFRRLNFPAVDMGQDGVYLGEVGDA